MSDGQAGLVAASGPALLVLASTGSAGVAWMAAATGVLVVAGALLMRLRNRRGATATR